MTGIKYRKLSEWNRECRTPDKTFREFFIWSSAVQVICAVLRRRNAGFLFEYFREGERIVVSYRIRDMLNRKLRIFQQLLCLFDPEENQVFLRSIIARGIVCNQFRRDDKGLSRRYRKCLILQI